MANDKEILMTDLIFTLRKNLKAQKTIYPNWGFFLAIKIFFGEKKSYQYTNSNSPLFGLKSYKYLNSSSPLFGPIVKKHIGSFSQWYCRFGIVQQVYFFFGPKNWMICSGAIWANVCKKIIYGTFERLGKWWRNAVDQFEFQGQEQNLGPKKQVSQILERFFGKKKEKVTNIK